MTLIYRAVWDDPDHNPIAVLHDEFRRWCWEKGLPADDIPYRGSAAFGDQVVDVRRGDSEFGRVLRVQLAESDPRGRQWTTTATALCDREANSYWVDVDCVDPVGGRVEIAAPRLVRQILAESGSPVRGSTPLAGRHHVVLGALDAKRLVSQLFDQSRELPIVVFSPDLRQSVEVNDQRALAAAEILAGLGAVWLIAPSAIDAFNAELPPGFRVFNGAARLYLPAVRPEDADDSARHRWYPPRLFERERRRAGLLIAQRLAGASRWPDPPVAWEQLRSLITRPTEDEIAARRAALAVEANPALDELDQLRADREQLLELLVIAESESEAIKSDLGNELAELRRRHDALLSDSLDDTAAMEELSAERDALRASFRELALRGIDGEESQATREIAALPTPLSPSEAIEMARVYLAMVEIPEAAVRDVDRLDESPKDRIWASTSWEALRALHDYAVAVTQDATIPGFFLWCQQTSAFPTNKIAMVESESVRNDERLARCRMLPVSVEVEPTGQLMMEAHLKIQGGGGPLIPRLYFHDDTGGRTGKMHVGFYGPHALMPNTKTN